MYGISSTTKDAIARIVEDIFDRLAMQLIGEIPRLRGKKIFVMNTHKEGLAHLFIQAMGNRAPNAIERDALKSLLDSSFGFIESLKSKTRSHVAERIDGMAREARIKGTTIAESQIQEVIKEELGKAGSHMKTIAEAESSKLRNLGTAMDIVRVSSGIGDKDPNVFFIMVRDGSTCKECIRLHMNPDGTPKVWKFSELKQGYHKRGEDTPSAFGAHPHCFTGSQLLHTDKGLISFEDLYKSQEAPRVLVDFRIKNMLNTGNQFGKPIPGSVRFDNHSKTDGRFLDASPVYDTGIQEVIRFTFESGQTIEVTEGHEMWTEVGNTTWAKKEASLLSIGDKVPLSANSSCFGKDSFPLEAELMGNLLGDGSLQKKWATWIFFGDDIPYGESLYSRVKESYTSHMHLDKLTIFPPNEKYNVSKSSFSSSFLAKKLISEFGLTKKPRRVPVRLFSADEITVSSFLRGLFAADGHSERNGAVLAQNDVEFLKEIQLLLNMFGFTSRIFDHGEACQKEIRYADGSTYLTDRKSAFRLQIGGEKQYGEFLHKIGFGVPKKQERGIKNHIKSNHPHGNWISTRIEKIEKIGKLQTYCLTEPMANTVSVNGIVTGQCRCTLSYLSPGFSFNSKGLVAWKKLNHDEYKHQRE